MNAVIWSQAETKRTNTHTHTPTKHTMEPQVASVYRNSDSDQSAHILHPDLLFPWAQRACTQTQNPLVCSRARTDSPRLIHHSVTATRPNLGGGAALSLHSISQICLSLRWHQLKKERQRERKTELASQKTKCRPTSHTYVHVHTHTHPVVSVLVSFQS